MNAPNKFLFVDKFENQDSREVFVGVISSGISSSNKLLEEIESKFRLPSYFGCNWNALYDCLRDFDWLDQKTVVIVHHELPSLPKDELKTYLEVLRDASENWRPEETHELRVVLPAAARNEVLHLLSSA